MLVSLRRKINQFWVDACNEIYKRIEQEKQTDEIQKLWYA